MTDSQTDKVIPIYCFFVESVTHIFFLVLDISLVNLWIFYFHLWLMPLEKIPISELTMHNIITCNCMLRKPSINSIKYSSLAAKTLLLGVIKITDNLQCTFDVNKKFMSSNLSSLEICV
jgi:hypothetical protein